MQQHWLVKSEPEAFSWQDLQKARLRTTMWDGVRNYQARNYLRDGMRLGDKVFFYQSCAKPLGIVGTLVVVRTGYPDPTQFKPRHAGYDPGSKVESPRWFAVDVRLERSFVVPVTLAALRAEPALQEMVLLRKGSRLSVQPVERQAWKIIERMADALQAREPA